MKWFQVDSDTPNDPKIRRLLDSVPGHPDQAAQLIGHLFLLWCHVANHGGGDPGLAVKADGTALDRADMAYDCRFRSEAALVTFLDDLAKIRLIDPAQWAGGIVFLPAMKTRADEYARRKGRGTIDPGGGGAGESGGNSPRLPRKPRKPPVQDNTRHYKEKDQNPLSAGADPSGGDLLANAGEDTVDALVRVWNDIRSPGPAIREITDPRRRAYARAVKAQPDLAKWRTVILWLNTQRWCNAQGTGDHPNWRATLDWLAKPGKLVELHERAGADRLRVRPDGSKGRDPAKGRTGHTPGEFGAALHGDSDGDAIH